MDGPSTPLEDVIATAELERRTTRGADFETESRALLGLARELATSPAGFLQALSLCAMTVCKAQSAGISILEGNDTFRWHAVSGKFAPNIWGTMPRDASPCGVVIERNAAQLMIRPQRAFPILETATPMIAEALLVPFYVHRTPVGTIWVLMHDESRRFDAEDARMIANLGEFASSAYSILNALTAANMAGTAPPG